MRRSWKITAIALFSFALVLGGLLGDRLLALTNEARDSLRLYTELVNVAHDRYGDEVSYRDLVYSSINGMLRALDPHTNFLSPEAYEGMREKQQSSFYGLGILVGMRNGQLTVISPIEGTPASRLGIQAGDVISTIEGDPTGGEPHDGAIARNAGQHLVDGIGGGALHLDLATGHRANVEGGWRGLRSYGAADGARALLLPPPPEDGGHHAVATPATRVRRAGGVPRAR